MPNTTHTAQPKFRCLILSARAEESIAPFLVDRLLMYGTPDVQLEPVWLLDREYGEVVTLQIPRALESADAVIADLTGADPNVMYEMGFAHALKKPVLPIVQEGDTSITSDLQGYLYYVYNPRDPEKLVMSVTRWLTRIIKERSREQTL